MRWEVRSQNAAQQKWHGDEGSPGVSSTSSSASRNPHGMGKSLFHGRQCITLLKDSENAPLAGSKGSQGDGSFECSDDAGSFGRHGVSLMKKLVDENQVLAGAGSGNAIDTSSEKGEVNESSSSMRATCHYDICPPKAGTTFSLKPSLLEKNREMRNIVKRSMQGPKEKAKIVKTCRTLGMGHGGFYRPGYRDGAKLNLHMMCLGKNWDPDERIYGSIQSNDGTNPPAIPQDFIQLVKKAMKSLHEVISEESGVRNALNILPNVSRDICLVNFYSTSGKLGLHQDLDKSRDSLDKGVPAVSFSIGDSAEFLYGDQRDIEKAEKVVLEFGDVLIFGGRSRHVFHGVTFVIPDSAPKMLVDEINLRPGG